MYSRLRAFLIHFIGSILLVCLASALVFLIWHPAPLHQAVGATNMFVIIMAVDVVLGPLMTLIVYKPDKKTLYFDMTIILFFQLAVFAYGVWTVAEGRPVWLVFNGDRFDLVRAYELDISRCDENDSKSFCTRSWLGPGWVAAKGPEDEEERNKLIFESLFAGVDIPQRADLYIPLEKEMSAMVRSARPLKELNNYNPGSKVHEALKRWPNADAYLPMMSPVKAVTVLINKDAGKVVAIVDLTPWE